jgi:hypothetical protein
MERTKPGQCQRGEQIERTSQANSNPEADRQDIAKPGHGHITSSPGLLGTVDPLSIRCSAALKNNETIETSNFRARQHPARCAPHRPQPPPR